MSMTFEPGLRSVKFVKEARVWPKAAIRRASVNSFGFGGSNAHVVIDDADGYLQSMGITANTSSRSGSTGLSNGTTRESEEDINESNVKNGNTNGNAHGNINGNINSNTNGNKFENINGKLNGNLNGTTGKTLRHTSFSGETVETKAKVNGLQKANGVNETSTCNGHRQDTSGQDELEKDDSLNGRNAKTTNNEAQVSRAVGGAPYLLSWSASDEDALKRIVGGFTEHLQTPRDHGYLRDLSYTLSKRRTTFNWRCAAVLGSYQDATNLGSHLSAPIRSEREPATIFAFTGQGAQYKQMGLDLVQYSLFENVLRRCDSSFQRLGCEWSLFDVLRGDDTRVNQAEYSQPLCTALQIALVDLLRNFNLSPSAVIGHSSGEIAAAYAAGGLDLDSACKVAYFRGKFAAQISSSGVEGSMLAVGLSESDVIPYLASPETTIACVNSPVNITISGPKNEIHNLHARLESAGIFSRELNTGVAYHSPTMNQVAGEYAGAIKDIAPPSRHTGTLRIVSTVTGELVTDIACFSDPQYWVRNLVSPVQFSNALLQLTAKPKGARKLGKKAQVVCSDVVEIGPHAALKRPVEETLSHNKRQLRYHASLSRNETASTHLIKLMGQMFCLGYEIDLARVNRLDPNARIRTLTDLPAYSFSHTRSYWRETTLSAGTAKRRHFPRPLIGAPVADWNPLEPKWRQYLSVQGLPWVVDHQVDNAILFPGAAMVVLAVEAAHQMTPDDARITGYRIKEATFSSPIVIPFAHEEHAEIETTYKPIWMPSANGSSWSEVRISVRNGDAVQEACRVVLKVETEHPLNGLDDGSEITAYKNHLREHYRGLASSCDKSVDAKAVYRTYSKMGLQYGPVFQGVQQPAWNGVDTCKAEILMGKNEGSEVGPDDFPIHPATLDILAHLMFVPLTNGGVSTVPTSLPTRIRDAWISNEGRRDNRIYSMRGVARSWKRDFKVVEGTSVMLNDRDEPIFALGTLEFSTITRSGPESDQGRFVPIFFSLKTKPDITVMDKTQLQTFIEPGITPDTAESEFVLDLQQALQWFISNTLHQLTDSEIETLQPHLRKYVDWMRLQQKTFPQVNEGGLNDEVEKEALMRKVEAANDRGRIYVTFGRQLTSIVRGTTDPLELLFSQPLAEEFYVDLMRSVGVDAKVHKFLDAVSFKNPSMKILEVGAGTGSITSYILAPLLGSGAPRFSRYDYTDVSAGFFERAKEKFATEAPIEKFDFRIFDLESNPLSQGLEASSYDLIVAASVIHATSNLKDTLTRLRTVLKPGGKLILFEVLRPECLRVATIFGTLPGWWASTDFRADGDRRWGPNITTAQWQSLLTETGFTVDAVVADHKDELCHEFGFIFATAVDHSPSVNSVDSITLIVNPSSKASVELATALDYITTETGLASSVKTISLDEIRDSASLEGQRLVILAEVDSPLLRNISEAHYDAISMIASSGKSVIWVHGVGQNTDQFADFQMINGLARVLRCENPNRPFVTLALENSTLTGTNADTIRKLLQQLEDGDWSIEQCEQEYVEHQNTLQISRVFEEEEMDSRIFSRTSPQLREERWDSAGPLALTVHSPGLLDSLCFIADPLAREDVPIQAEEVLVDVRVIGLNFRDVLIALGAMDTDRLGVECTGIVREAGSNSSLRPGDRVIIPKIGCARTMQQSGCDKTP